MIDPNESERRISAARKFLEVANRMETGKATDQEIIDAFISAPAKVIDEIEAEAKARGMPPLPAVLNPGSPQFRAAMERYKEVHAMGDEATPQEIMLSFIKMFRLAPPWWKAEMDHLFDENFSLPPDGYTDDGNPVFSVGAISKMIGRSEEEIRSDLADLEGAGFQLTTTEQINSIN